MGDTLVGAGVEFDPSTGTITFDAAAAGLSFESGETLAICFAANDSVPAQFCGPNEGDSVCVSYVFDLAGPTAEVVEPAPASFSACHDQNILIRLTDDLGVSRSSIHLRVNGVEYTLSDSNLSYVGDTLLVFYPPGALPEGEINVVLWGVVDGAGNPMAGDSLAFSFFTDYSPPYVVSVSPSGGSVVSDTAPSISIGLSDDGSGVADSSIVVSLNGVGLTLADGCVAWDGSVVTVEPSGCGIAFSDGDTVEVCVRAADKPDYCPPNSMPDTCWLLYISSSGPVVQIVLPLDGWVTACADQEILLAITDGNGVDPGSIQLSVDGVVYTTGDAELVYHDDTLRFSPSSPWSDGDTVDVVLLSADDVLGTPSPDLPLSWSFVVDLSPPYVVSVEPPPTAGFSVPDTTIKVILRDELAGVNPFSINLQLGSHAYPYPSGDMDYYADTLSFSLSGMGYTPLDGESLLVCVWASDAPQLCAPNTMDPYCFRYYFDYRGPQVNLFFPPESLYVSCWDTTIIWTVWDPAGVDSASIEVGVGGGTCDLTSPLLRFEEPYLVFRSDTGYVEGELFEVEVLSVSDGVGNVEGPFAWWVGFDTTAPQISDPYPPDGGVCTTPSPVLSVAITDNAAGVFPAYAVMVVDGAESLAYYEGELSWDGSRLSADLAALGVALSGGDTVEVCVFDVFDSTAACAPNRADDFCWSFRVDVGGPVAELVTPPNGVVTSCAQETIVITFHDEEGVDWTLTRIMVDGTEYWATSPQVTLIDDSTLSFVPSAPFPDGDTVEFYVVQSSDTLGHIVTSYPHWSFVVDVSPPRVVWVSAPEGGALPLVWRCALIDSVAGVDTASVVVSVDGMPAPISFSGDTVIADLTGFAFSDGETVMVCVSAADLVNWCPPNEMERCFDYFVDLAPPRALLLWPPVGATSACSDQRVAWLLSDAAGVDEGTISLEFEGETLGVSDPRVSFEGDTLIFTPGALSDGDTVRVVLLSAADEVGNEAFFGDVAWFVVDLSPPYLGATTPTDGAVVSDPEPVIMLELVDDISGVDGGSIVATLNGDTVSFYWDGSAVRIFCDSLGISFADGETVTVCVSAWDSPDLCPPNVMPETCITFYVSLSGPAVRVILPLPESFVACGEGEQFVALTITDPDGVDEGSIEFVVDGDTLTLGSAALDFVSDTLIYTPAVPWSDGDTVSCALIAVSDLLGNGLAAPVEWSFFVDLSPPRFLTPDPPHGSTVSDLSGGISVDVVDDLSGVCDSSLVLWLSSGDTFDLTSGLVWDGVRALVPDSLLPALGGSVEVCVSAADLPDYCEANSDTFCWSFVVAGEGPAAAAVSPLPGQIISCRADEQRLVLYLHDPDGVDEGSIELLVGGAPVAFAYSADTLVHIPASPWGDGDTVFVTLTAADVYGNAMSSPLEFWFVVDTMPPVAFGEEPPSGATAGSPSPVVSVVIVDSIAGVDTASIALVVNGDTLTLDSTGVSYEGDTLILDCSAAGISFELGETVYVCVVASDLAQLCGENEMPPLCWWFTVPSCLVAAALFPPAGVVTSCADQGVDFVVEGAAIDSAIILVSGDTASPSEVILHGDTISFRPLAPFASGESVSVVLAFAADTAGLPICGAVAVDFVVDLAPPVAEVVAPAPGSTIPSPAPIVSVWLFDSIAGVDTASIALVVNGDTLTLDSVGVSYEGDTLTLDCSVAGISFSSGEVVSVCVLAADAAQICPPNEMSPLCWSFTVSFEGPVAELLFPFVGAYVACEDTALRILLSDPDGVDEGSIVLDVGGVPYTLDSAALNYEGDTLHFALTAFGDGDTVSFTLLSASDLLGNPLSAPLSGWFILDFAPPAILSWGPSSVVGPSPLLWFVVVDSGAGLDLSALAVGTDALWLDTTSSAVWLEGDTLFFDCAAAGVAFDVGDTTVCLHAEDIPDFCPPNVLDTCVVLEVLPGGGGPTAELVSPPDGATISCDGGMIEFVLEDPDGLLTDSLGVAFGDTLRLVWSDAPPGLDVSGDTVRFNLPGAFESGDTVRFSPLGCDVYFNPVAPYSWSFVVDLEPPSSEFLAPASPSFDSLAPVVMRVWDEIAGVCVDSLRVGVETPRFVRFLGVDSAGVYWDGETLSVVPDEVNGGAPWTPEDDSTLLFFHERETVFVYLSACDGAELCGANCAVDTFAFWTADDDTMPPRASVEVFEFAAGETVDVSIPVFDESGLGDCCWAVAGGETISVSVLGSGDSFIVSFGGFVAPRVGETLWVELHLCDADFDFNDTADVAETTYAIPIVSVSGEGPSVVFVFPQDGDYTSCADGPVVALLSDPDGVDTAGVVFVAAGETLRVEWRGDSAYLSPPEGWADGETVTVVLAHAADALGNPAQPESVSFVVDLLPPNLALVSPPQGIVDPSDVIRFAASDELSGVGSVIAISGGDTFALDVGEPSVAVGELGEPGETLWVSVIACDRALYCGANCALDSFWFVAAPQTPCDAYPIPFTPNGDGVNDRVYFDFPEMAKFGATVTILTPEGAVVRTLELPAALPETRAFWDGTRDDGTPAPQGIYVYIVSRGGEVLCKGTIALVR